MRDELFDLDMQDAEDIMNGYDRLVMERHRLGKQQRKRDALNYYLKQNYSIEDAMYMAGYQQETSRK
jgi:hypothetical protein|tara:strand:- start:13 stop:213 length:201 start_codon:yes stop_codon:yes gene_type:complete